MDDRQWLLLSMVVTMAEVAVVIVMLHHVRTMLDSLWNVVGCLVYDRHDDDFDCCAVAS